MKRKYIGTIKKDFFSKRTLQQTRDFTHFFRINFFMSIIFFSIKNTTLFMHNCARKIVVCTIYVHNTRQNINKNCKYESSK